LLISQSPAAKRDLDDIWYTIGIDNVAAADRVIDLIDARIQQLPEHPLSGPARNDLGDGIRHLVAGQYLVLYRVSEGHIVIVRVFHGNRRLPTRL
jgi:toxin ParE1/3/4